MKRKKKSNYQFIKAQFVDLQKEPKGNLKKKEIK